MTEPKIEYKHSPQTPIALLEAKLNRKVVEARTMLKRLEVALVRCGYQRDAIYNSTLAGWSRRHHGRGVVLWWQGGKILVGRGYKKKQGKQGKPTQPLERIPPAGVDDMSARDLALVAAHLSPFVDFLEDNVRHQLEELEGAIVKMQEFIVRIETDPKPAETPGYAGASE